MMSQVEHIEFRFHMIVKNYLFNRHASNTPSLFPDLVENFDEASKNEAN